MKVFALLLASSLAVAGADIIVQDNFIDHALAADVNAQLSSASTSSFRNALVNVPGHLYQRLLSVIMPEQADAAASAATTTMHVVPGRGEHKSVHAHKDSYACGQGGLPTEAQVGVMYLEGDGKMIFTHEMTGEKTVVDVMPGRLISWDNAVYTHALEAGALPRRMLGPMAFKDGALHAVGVLDSFIDSFDGVLPFDGILYQAYASNLLVAAGGWVTVTVDFVVTEWPTACGDSDRRSRRLADGGSVPLTELELTCTAIINDGVTPTSKYNHTSPSSSPKQKQFGGAGKYDQDEVTLKFSKLTPQTWKPRLTYDLENDGNTVMWTLPEDSTLLNKQYKMTSKFYVGKNLNSGDEIIFIIEISNVFTEELVVTVK